MVSKWWFEFSPESKLAPQSSLETTSIVLLFRLNCASVFYLILTPAQPTISNHCLETMVYRASAKDALASCSADSQDMQPPQGRSWTTEVECQTPARSTNPNSWSPGPALWEFFRKSAVLQGKRPWRAGKRWPKSRYRFSCLKVRAGALPYN